MPLSTLLLIIIIFLFAILASISTINASMCNVLAHFIQGLMCNLV
jgi:hypothetical protein